MNNIFSKIKKAAVALIALPLIGGMLLASCSDEPDSASYYTFKGQMMSQYLESSQDFSQFATIVKRAGIMDQLSAYGHYTCFLPNNKAIDEYLAGKGIKSLDELTDADCDTIARTHLMTEIYSVSDMNKGMLPSQNMLRRNVEVDHTLDADMNSVVIINGKSTIYFEHQDDSVENGIVQQIDVVLENSTSSIGSIMQKNDRIKLFAEAIHLTGLDERLDSIEDRAYAQRYKDGYYVKEMSLKTGSRNPEAIYCPEKKLYGFTAFVVPDDILKTRYNIETIEQLYNKACQIYDEIYPEDVDKEGHKFENLNDSVNPLYRLLAYHILDRNVQGYNYLTVRDDAGVDIDIVNPTEWYPTLLPYTMMKVEKLTVKKWLGRDGVEGDRYINRRYNENYFFPGVHVLPNVEPEYDNNAVNGIYFYVDDLLKFDSETRDKIQNDRIRMDFSTIFPEIMTNNMRMNGPALGGNETGRNYYFPQGYLDNVELKGDSRMTYWYPQPGYYSMNGDEMDAQNVFDITFNIPPIPFTGEWQIRLGFAPMSKSDGAERGQVQVYVDGKAQGIPLNMEERLNATSIYGSATYTEDYSKIRDDADARQEDFKILKNKGYYRGPYSVFNSSNGKISGINSRFASNIHMARKVLCTLNLKAGVKHTIRIKNVSAVLPKNKEAMLDYLELVPKSVYGVSDGSNAEDDL